MTTSISNSNTIIDSRDVIARIENLREERTALVDTINEMECTNAADSEEYTAAVDALDAWDESEEGRELKALEGLAEDAEGYCDDWRHGAQLIRESYFEDYARELADDIDAIQKDNAWPYTCIDWGQAARELQMDYKSVEFDGVTYYVR